MISSAPKQFQKWISQVLEGTDGALCQIDDNLLVFDKMTEELDKHLEETPHKLQEANLTRMKRRASSSNLQWST